MDGEPVWLASVSLRRGGKIIGTEKWNGKRYEMAEKIAHRTLRGVGDDRRERAFRMNITFCIHRALKTAEKEKLPASFFQSPGGVAGPPVEVLWARGIRHRLAAMPCRNPARSVVIPERPDLWVPNGCESCDPCRARNASLSKGNIDG